MQTLRRQGRIYALQLLYQAEIDPAVDEAQREAFFVKGRVSMKARAFATRLVETTLAGRERIDDALGEALEHWKLGRLPVIVRNVLRLSVCELLLIGEEPPAAVINEAIELTRTYMDEDSSRFVNAVLDRVRLAGEAPPEPQALESR
jgi:N utilization substance protein B